MLVTSLAERSGGDRDPTAPAPVPGDAGAVLLWAEIAELEDRSRFDDDDMEPRAERALAAAREVGLPELERRARLVQADLVRRRGNVAEAGRLAEEIHRWAADNSSRYLLARSHFVLTAVFQELGDLSLALEHAVRAVELLDDDVRAEMRIDHHARLADCLGLNGDLAARDRYDHVLQLAEEVGDVDRQLLVLNNRAYSETLSGRFDEALVWSTELQALAARHGVPLRVGRLDTVGRALMELGRLEDAEAVMLPGLHPEVLDASLDGDAGADFLLTLAEIHRRRGHLEQAQESLHESVRRCERYGLTSIRVRARREQAELHAAAGRFRAAYGEHKLYCDELMELQSAERDARARALQAMYETTEARQQSRRYRELSLRDALTGLYNRRYVDEELPRLLAAHPGNVTVALLDLDHFKRINDTCSHEAGDRVLVAVAELLQQCGGAGRAKGWFVARLGGEEFLLVLTDSDPGTATAHLEDVRRTIAAHPWAELTGGLPVTVSIGAAGTEDAPDPAPADLLGRADARLYAAKRQGRDRVVIGG
ncbi:tetratricopeptide repeat-containing diguanylate cyclase [Blastococcus capsensis]|uniref:tetratricopeptide repeat-containing diguanylate cyclase n=1 Tax=Blastococcus capsensis TaxID=1564163 RepID=UPI002541374B|nr:GGDEF domain-containing protein [Blastococcus capsensis]MDK3256874.1 GGDEF domain-containing protein [Blastococcus capsensis]